MAGVGGDPTDWERATRGPSLPQRQGQGWTLCSLDPKPQHKPQGNTVLHRHPDMPHTASPAGSCLCATRPCPDTVQPAPVRC